MKWVVVLLAITSIAGLIGASACASPSPGSGYVPDADDTDNDDSPDAAMPSDMWTDIPLYGNAQELESASWSVPVQDTSDYAVAQWRYYRIPGGTAVSEVAQYYMSEMPLRGWEEMFETNTDGFSMLLFSRDGEDDLAYIWVGTDDDDTVLALMRASR